MAEPDPWRTRLIALRATPIGQLAAADAVEIGFPQLLGGINNALIPAAAAILDPVRAVGLTAKLRAP